MDLATFFAVVIVGFIASFSFGVTSFGLTLVFVIGWVQAHEWFGLGTGQIREAMGYMCALESISAAMQFLQYRKRTSWPVVAIVVPIWYACEALAAAAPMDTEALRFATAVVLASVYLIEEGWLAGLAGGREAQPLPPFTLRSTRCVICVGILACLGGALRAYIGITIPATVAFVLYSGMERETFRATFLCVNLLTTPVKLAGILYRQLDVLPSLLPGYIGVLLVSIPAFAAAKHVADRISVSQFRHAVLHFALLGAGVLFAETPAQQLAVCAALFCAAAGLADARHGFSRHKRDDQAAPDLSKSTMDTRGTLRRITTRTTQKTAKASIRQKGGHATQK